MTFEKKNKIFTNTVIVDEVDAFTPEKIFIMDFLYNINLIPTSATIS